MNIKGLLAILALIVALVVSGNVINAGIIGGADGPTAIIVSQVPGEPVITHCVQMDVAGYGAITAVLYGEEAPITVENFVRLVESGFYDGLTFHRIISGFMIQGGDPLGNGMGGSDKAIKGEFSANGVDNSIKHTRGALSMARTNAPDSATSQFFIMHEDAPHLDGQYAAFGKVIAGMEVVDAICANTPVQDGNGTVAKADQPVITSVKLIDMPAQ